jgi:hypothetical protein
VFYAGEYVWVCGCVGVYTKSKTSELSPLLRKLLRFAKQFPPPLRSNMRFLWCPETYTFEMQHFGKMTIKV